MPLEYGTILRLIDISDKARVPENIQRISKERITWQLQEASKFFHHEAHGFQYPPVNFQILPQPRICPVEKI